MEKSWPDAVALKRLLLDLIARWKKRFFIPPQRACSFPQRVGRIGELIRHRNWPFVGER